MGVRVSVMIVEDQHSQQDAARHHAHDEVEIRPYKQINHQELIIRAVTYQGDGIACDWH